MHRQQRTVRFVLPGRHRVFQIRLRRWLRAQLVGLETVSRRLAGDEVSWVEEVQLCHGVLDAMGEIADPRATPLRPDPQRNGSTVLFAGSVPCRASGQFGFSVRVLPRHPNLPHPFEPGLVTWG